MRAIHTAALGLAIAAAALTTTLVVAGGEGHRGPDDPQPTLRIGTYDNRTIAIAYASSAYLHEPLQEKKAELEQAKQDGDEERVKELEQWGQMHQRLLHFQGFGKYPVDDLLAHVADKIPAVAEANDLDAIVWLCDYNADDVEIIDVTEDLADLFHPIVPANHTKEQQLQWIRSIKGQPFVPFETLVDMPANE